MAVYTYAGNRRKWDFTSSLLLDTGVRVCLGQHAEFGANDYAQLSPHYLFCPGAVAVDMSQFPWFDPNDVDGSVAHGDPAPAPFCGYVLLDASGYIDPSTSAQLRRRWRRRDHLGQR